MSVLTDDDRQFLAEPRLGFLTVAPTTGWPTPVPVWFECIDDTIELFTSPSARKAKRVEATPRASIVAANAVGESEHWIAIEGRARVEQSGGYELAERLAARYWNLESPSAAAVLEAWKSEAFIRIVIEIDKVNRYVG